MGGVAKAVGLGGPNYLENRGPFGMSKEARLGETEAINRLRQQASGQGESITELKYQQAMQDIAKQQQSAAASARGVSNAGLMQRQAMLGGQQAGLDVANQAAAAKLAEQRSADQLMSNIASGQRGSAIQSSLANQQAQNQSQERMAGFFGNLGTAGAKIALASATGMAEGGEVKGEEIVPGDSPLNDTEPHMLSAGEIVIPKSAAKDKESAVKFLEALKFDSDSRKKSQDKPKSEESYVGQEQDYSKYAKGMATLLEAMAQLHNKK